MPRLVSTRAFARSAAEFCPGSAADRMLLVVAAALLVSCGRDSGPERHGAAVDTLPNGAVHIANSEVASWPREPWHLREDLRIGVIEGAAAEVFGRIASFAVDDFERIWILDSQARELRVFDSAGRHLRTVGRMGSGPGEFSRPHAVHKHPGGEVWVVDPGSRRYSAFDTSGTYLTSHPRTLQSATQPRSEGFDSQGRLMEMVGAIRDGRVTYALIRLHVERGEIVDSIQIPDYSDEIYEATVPQDGGTARYSSRVPFTPFLTWDADTRGYLWHAVTAPYRLIQQAFSGDTVRVVERTHAPVSVSPDERRKALEGMAQLRDMGASIAESRIPSVKPAIEYFFVDEEGYIWVQPVVPGTPTSDGMALTEFDVFDPDGLYLGRVRSPVVLTTNPAPPSRVSPIVRGSHMYGVHADSLGVQYLVRLRIDGRQ